MIMDSEKYSLRHRQKRKQFVANSYDSQEYNSDNSMEPYANVNALKGSKTLQISANTKTKTKAAPLSKYRRKTANARERSRMREINSAFENLRHCVPSCITDEDAPPTNEKLTKITTLRLAMKYIQMLAEALSNPDEADYDLLHDCTQPKIFQANFIANDVQEEETVAANVCLGKGNKMKMAKVKMKNGSAKKDTNSSRSVNSRRINKKQTIKPCLTPYMSPVCLRYQESPISNASSSAYASMSSDFSNSPPSHSSCAVENLKALNNCVFNYNLPKSMPLEGSNNIILESDGESLNLSESCLSPLSTAFTSKRILPTLVDCVPGNTAAQNDCGENPLELSLRLMECSQDDSMQLTLEPPDPSSVCISPLISLEPFNPFDLFHSDLAEQSALDLFLT